MVLTLQGHIVAEWAEVLERECLEARRAGLRVVLDLSGVSFVGCSGIDVLGRLERAGVVTIVGCPPLIAETLEQDGIEVGRKESGFPDDDGPIGEFAR